MPYKTPKNCVVHRISLDSKKRVAEVGYRCSPPDGRLTAEPMDEHGRTGPFHFKTPGGGTGQGNYPRVILKNIGAIDFRGMSVNGNVAAHFVLSPAFATCRKEGTTLRCKLAGDTSSSSLSGRRRKRR